MSRTWVDVAAAAVEWSDCGGGRGSAGIRSSNLGKNMTKTPNPTTESDPVDDFGPVHGGDAPPFMGGPMGGQ